VCGKDDTTSEINEDTRGKQRDSVLEKQQKKQLHRLKSDKKIIVKRGV
jgi:hypothetical protein